MLAGALHAEAAVRYVVQAELRSLCHVLRADFIELLNVDQAVLTAARTVLTVVKA